MLRTGRRQPAAPAWKGGAGVEGGQRLRARRARESVAAGVVLLAATMVLSGCSPAVRGPVRKQDLADGVYRASHIQFPNRAVVEVTISDGAMTAIRLVSHIAWKGTKAEGPIVERMLASQSTEVDTVTGATNSSRCITKAVQKAIDKAYRK